MEAAIQILLRIITFFSTVMVPIPSQPPAIPTVAVIPTIPTQTEPIIAQIESRTMMLRRGPSTIHEVLRRYTEGEKVSILGKTITGEWVYVHTSANTDGWMKTEFLDLQGDLSLVPLHEPTDSYPISGSVKLENGAPAPQGVTVAISSDNPNLYTDTHTDAKGNFEAYVPNKNTDTWKVSVTGLPCLKSGADFDCSFAKNTLTPNSELVPVPQTKPIEFILRDLSNTPVPRSVRY